MKTPQEKMNAEFPIIMGRQITRAEIIQGLRECYQELCQLKRRQDPTFVRYPDMETILDHLEDHGLPANDHTGPEE